MLFDVILKYIDIFVIFEKADRVALAAGQEPQLSERILSTKTYFDYLQRRYSLGNSTP